jgi:hypothetical protein
MNAMTSYQFVAFAKEKLALHGATKVVGDEETLANVYRAFVRSERERVQVEELERDEKARRWMSLSRLAARVRGRLNANPTAT